MDIADGPFDDRKNMGVPELKAKDVLLNFTRSWKRRLAIKILLYAISASLLLTAFCYFLLPFHWLVYFIFPASFFLSLFIFYKQLGYPLLNPSFSARYLNTKIPALEYSTQLLLQKLEELSIPARMQYRRLQANLLPLAKVKPPVSLTKAAGILLLSLVSSLALVHFAGALSPSKEPLQPLPEEILAGAEEVEKFQTSEAPELSAGKVRVLPPAYTGKPAFHKQIGPIEAAEGSLLRWEISFTDSVEQAWLSLSEGDSIPFKPHPNGQFQLQWSLNKNLLYQIIWKGKTGKLNSTDYYRLELIPDQAPLIKVEKPASYVRQKEPIPFMVQVKLKDDYGLTEAYLQLTISSGSGENVSFEKQQIPFEYNFSKGISAASLRTTLDPQALGMEPGYELYFYVVAFDNRQPQRQKSRTETYFYQWEDTAAVSFFEMDGMAMDIMPEYFRSQRQIIIDTEKLIVEQAELSAKEFEKRANNLGVDQKLLRLRYGKFLGEEFESGYGAEVLPEEGEQKEEHSHEGEGESPHQHEHQEKHQEGPPSAESLLSEFMHAHDTEEGATFYEERIKVKLKAALAEMWESELRLRTLRPKQALPYQYRALGIIKEVQQATRVYVERIGFEPPPLKPQEKRLTGNLEEVQSVYRKKFIPQPDSLTAIKKLVSLLQAEGRKEPGMSGEVSKELLRKAGNELAAIVQQQPKEEYLAMLKLLNEMINGRQAAQEVRQFLSQTLIEVLPAAEFVPHAPDAYRSRMERAFMQKIGGAGE